MADATHCYVAKDLDGKIFEAIVDSPERAKDVARFTSSNIRRGASIERMELPEFRNIGLGDHPFRLPKRSSTGGKP